VAQKDQQQSEVVVVGAASHPLRDAYHLVLEMSWPAAIGLLSITYLALNTLFAFGYMLTGGVNGARSGSFADAFFFSVQTMGTIGYGALSPKTLGANLLMTAESIVGLIVTALATGVVFARFSRVTGQVIFSRYACLSPMDAVPSLTFRIGNDRAGTIYEARVNVSIIRTERTKEGHTFYRLYDLPLVRSVSQALARSFLIIHRIDDRSPLWEQTPESCAEAEVELLVTVAGTDETSLQPVHGRHRYDLKDLLWGARLTDILRELPDGRLELDMRKFHLTEPTQATTEFPYPRKVA
jgi:inward rectifier potassium channel